MNDHMSWSEQLASASGKRVWGKDFVVIAIDDRSRLQMDISMIHRPGPCWSKLQNGNRR